MARPIRIQFPGAIYHVIQRGFRREKIFADDMAKEEYMTHFYLCAKRFQVDLYSWCLMDNHVHLLFCTQQPNLSRFMHAVNASFANTRQRYRSLDGPVFAGRYKSLLVDCDAWLLQVSMYIHLNPVRARMVKHAADYQWSSCADFLDSRSKKRYGLQPEDILDLMNAPKRKNYQQKMLEDRNMELPPIHRSVGYGECELTEVMNKHLSKESDNLEFHQEVRFDHSPERIIQVVIELTKVTSDQLQQHKKNNFPRELACFALRTITTLTLKEIGKYLNMSYFSVCNTNKKFKRKLLTDRNYTTNWQKLKRGLNG
jgi:REP element-mobilizing transposase RayT